MTECNIPKSLTSIELGLFEECHKMKAFTIPNTVKKIDKWAFLNTGIDSIDIPASVESIEQAAFNICLSLNKVTLHSGLKSIGDYCFYDTDLTQIYIPSSVTKIGEQAFHNKSWLEVTLYSEKTAYVETYASENGYSFKNGNMSDSTDTISSQSGIFSSGQKWSYDAGTQTMTLTGKGEIKKYDYNSEHYDLFQKVSNAAKQLVIGEGITKITWWWYFSKIEIVSLPSTIYLEDEEDYINILLSGMMCPQLREYKISSSNPYYSCENGVLFNKAKTTLFSYPPQKSGSMYTVPSNVTKINDYAFHSCGNLFNITIPDGVKIIGSNAFNNCYRLTNIVIPDSVTELGECAFCGCRSLYNAVVGNTLSTT